MMFTRTIATGAALVAVASASFIVGGAGAGSDFGAQQQNRLADHAKDLFGFEKPVAASSTVSADLTAAKADPRKLVTLAKGLKARVVTSGNAAPILDQMILWPSVAPTHIISCNEGGIAAPGVQRIALATGVAETILSGTISCDPVRATPWGTVIVGEENGGGGQLLEIADPLVTTNVSFDRVAGTVSGADAANVAVRRSVGTLSWESIALFDSGLMYYGDENRPSNGTQGGAYFKYVPTTPWDGVTMVASGSDLGASPLADGTVYGLRVGKRGAAGTVNGGNDFGQGTQTGQGAWVKVCQGAAACTGLNLRTATVANKLTGYYRPEDAEIDASALAAGQVKFCANNTGNEGEDHSWGETICLSDGSLAGALTGTATPDVQYFNIGTADLAMVDNIAQQPMTGNWVLHEDGDIGVTGKNNDLFICLPDGMDADALTDGCVRMATLNDLPTNDPAAANHGEGAEWTGGFFDPSGQHFYVSVQHNMTGFGVLLDITGFANIK
jgi:secreted PhoX family phosphatase